MLIGNARESSPRFTPYENEDEWDAYLISKEARKASESPELMVSIETIPE